MAKQYVMKFGSLNASRYTGLTPTFTVFYAGGLTAVAPPGITETPVGSGLYNFSYDPTMMIEFEVDAGSSVTSSDRYITDVLDPIQAVDQKVGFTTDSFGSTSVDPSTLMGFAKRALEDAEGNAVFNKTTGIWDIYSRGSSTLLREKQLTNTVSTATKS